jgi:multicomponent Na+:H+ antiporter subunit F
MHVFVYIGFAILTFAALLCLYRIGAGPTAPDRAVAIDILGTLLVGFCALLALETDRDFYLNVAIAWALLSFIGSIALAKFLEGKGFDE